MKPYFADTWFFLALLNPDDQAHERVHEFAAQLQRRVVTTDWIMVEVADALCSPSHRHLYRALLSILRGEGRYSVVKASRLQVNEGSELYVGRPDKAWSLTDCISFVLLRKRGIFEALTADRHFDQAGFKAVFLT